MTPQERRILEDAENQAFLTAQQLQDSESVHLPEPEVSRTETVLEGDLFGLEFGGEPTAEVFPTSTSGGGGPPPCSCSACCGRDITEISSIDVTLQIDANFTDAVHCTGSRTDEFTWNFTRIDQGTSFTDPLQFKFYLGAPSSGCCSLNFVSETTSYVHDFGKSGDICESGTFRFPTFDATFAGDCCSGTLDLTDNSGSDSQALFGGDSGCSDATCSQTASTPLGGSYASGLSFTLDDFSGIRGTYSVTYTDTSSGVGSIQITVTIVIS